MGNGGIEWAGGSGERGGEDGVVLIQFEDCSPVRTSVEQQAVPKRPLKSSWALHGRGHQPPTVCRVEQYGGIGSRRELLVE